MLIPLSVLVYCGAGGIKVGCQISVALLLCPAHNLDHCIARLTQSHEQNCAPVMFSVVSGILALINEAFC